jgi:hypothetical protein
MFSSPIHRNPSVESCVNLWTYSIQRCAGGDAPAAAGRGRVCSPECCEQGAQARRTSQHSSLNYQLRPSGRVRPGGMANAR